MPVQGFHAILEQDLFASIKNIEFICTEAAKLGMEVWAVPSRWGAAIPDHLMEHIRKQEALVKREMANAVGDTVIEQDKAVSTADHSDSEDLKEKFPEYRALSAPAKKKTSGIERLDELFDSNTALARQNDSLYACLQEVTLRQQQTVTETEAKHFTLEKGNTIENGKKAQEPFPGAIPAEIYETTTVMTGNRVKIRLLENARLSGQEISRNTFVYGICRTDNERLQIDVQQIQSRGQFLPVKITVCDLDGMPGLYVPDQAARKVTREVGGSVNTSSMAGFTTNPLAYAGVQAADRAARTMLQVIKQKKVTIKKNTLVYLINKNK